jgi:uncharacterized protein (DUF2147 family)
MKNLLLIVSALLALVTAQIVLAASGSPVGLWKTIDDVTGKPKAIVRITESSGVLQGNIIKIFPTPGYDQNERCDACEGSLHNQRIVGMTILRGLKADESNPGRWARGKILDPHNGKSYHCSIQLSNDANSLNVRGYIGISLFGRSQTWGRMNSVG